jgi:ATP-dependent DNA helicase Rep
VPGHQRRAIPPAEGDRRRCRRNSPAWATTTRASTPGAARIPDNLLALGTDYPALKIVKLEQNYRCSNRVLRAANAVIANNPHEHPKTLWSDQPTANASASGNAATTSTKPKGRRRDPVPEAHRRMAMPPWSEFCILFRGNHQSRALEKALQLLRIPYHLSGGTAFLDRGEVKDALAWLRLLANPDDDAAFLRAVQSPKREVGATSLAKLAELASTRTCRCRARRNRWAC